MIFSNMDQLQSVKPNTNLATEPVCMKERPSIDACRENLNREQLNEATQALISHSFTKLSFPKTQRLRNDPQIPRQNFGVITFTPSKEATPDKDGCFGVLKLRGNFDTEQDADEHCEQLIRNVDSYHENFIAYVGKDFPICANNDQFCANTREIDIRSKLDAIGQEKVKTERQKEEQEKKEIQERHRQLLSDVKVEQKYDDLEYYTTLRTKRAQARLMQEEYEKKLKELAKTLKKTNSDIFELDEKFPEYQKEYEQHYKKALDSIGGDHANKMIQYMK